MMTDLEPRLVARTVSFAKIILDINPSVLNPVVFSTVNHASVVFSTGELVVADDIVFPRTLAVAVSFANVSLSTRLNGVNVSPMNVPPPIVHASVKFPVELVKRAIVTFPLFVETLVSVANVIRVITVVNVPVVTPLKVHSAVLLP